MILIKILKSIKNFKEEFIRIYFIINIDMLNWIQIEQMNKHERIIRFNKGEWHYRAGIMNLNPALKHDKMIIN